MIDYREYPANWKTEIRPRIMARAGEVRDASGKIVKEAKCEWCNVENHTEVARDKNGKWHTKREVDEMYEGPGYELFGTFIRPKIVPIVLTVAHLDRDKSNHEVCDNRLAALCQRCHLNHDREHHLSVQKANRERRKGPMLFEVAQ